MTSQWLASFRSHFPGNAVRTLVVSSGVFLFAACTTTAGRDFQLDNVSKIKDGTTTAAEVQNLLGVPINKQAYAQGTEQWRYAVSTSRHTPTLASIIQPLAGGQEMRAREVLVTIKNGVVSECLYSTYSNETATSQTAWSAVNREGETRSIRCQDLR